MTTSLPFGTETMDLDVPDRNLRGILRPRPAPTVADCRAAIRRALRDPIGTLPLGKLATGKKDVVIIVDDWMRPTPVSTIVPIVLDELNGSGIPDDKITIVIATGARSLGSDQLLEKKLGKQILSRVAVLQHDSRDWRNMKFVGISRLGTPVWINSKVTAADLRIGVGNIMGSPWSGFSGGAKIVLPGVSSAETIWCNHRMQISQVVQQGNMDNPVREDIEEAGKLARLDFILNTILNQDNEVSGIVAGDAFRAHREGVNLARQIYGVGAVSPAEILIGAPGAPFDSAVDVSLRAILVGQSLVSDGGTIVIVAKCAEGWGEVEGGSSVFEHAHRASPDTILADLARSGLPQGDDTGIGAYILSTIRKTRRINLVFVTNSVGREEFSAVGIGHAPTANEACRRILSRYPPSAGILIVENCATMIPRAS